MNQTRPKLQKNLARDPKNLRILPENSAEDLGSRRKLCCSSVVSVAENTPKNIVVQGRA